MTIRKTLLLPAAVLTIAALGFIAVHNREEQWTDSPVPTSVSFHPQTEEASGFANCFLCNMGRMGLYEGNRLAFLSINSGSLDYVPLAQYEEDGSKRKYGYKGYRRLGDAALGCTLSVTTWPDAGSLEGVITPGEHPEPDLEQLNRLFCPNCRACLMEITSGHDLLLVDFEEQTLFDLCSEQANLTIGDYSVQTTLQKDGTIHVEIHNGEAI